MTVDNTGMPEDDDPFGYLYRSEGDGSAADGGDPAGGRQAVPRRSFAQATQVGRTQYGQRAQQGAGAPAGYGYPGQGGPTQQFPQQPGYGGFPQPGAYPQQGQAPAPGAGGPGMPGGPGGRAAGRAAGRSAGGRGANNRGVKIGAAAVVAAVVIGIGIAVFSNSGKNGDASASGSSPAAAAGASAGDSASAGASPSTSADGLPPVTDAATLTLAGVSTNTEHQGAHAAGGKFVETMPQGASITWTVRIQTAGFYRLYVRFANAGPDSAETVTVNGKPNATPINMKNYSKTNDWDHAWYVSWAGVQLQAGANTIVLSTSGPGQGNVNIDQLAITQNADSDEPSSWQ